MSVILFNGLVHGFNTADVAPLNGHPILGYVLANLVGTAISYRGTRWWAFRHRSTTHLDGGRTAFVAITVATMVIPMACLWFSRNVLGLDDPFVRQHLGQRDRARAGQCGTVRADPTVRLRRTQRGRGTRQRLTWGAR